MGKAYLAVDVQNDFIEGGSMGVEGGEGVALTVASHLEHHHQDYDLIVFTQDWHIDPGNHWSDEPDFTDTWPIHCEADTDGAEIHPYLRTVFSWLPRNRYEYVRKGQYEAAYSPFEGTMAHNKQLLDDYLKENGITELVVGGIATDHCVREAVLDALKLGYTVTVKTNQVAGVDPQRAQATLKEVEEAGATLA